MKTMKYIKVLLLVSIIIFSLPSVYGQYSKAEFVPYWEIDLNGGLSTFFGDLKQKTIIPESIVPSKWKFGGSVMIGKQISQVLGLRIQFLTGELLGGEKELDRYFESNYYEANLNATVNLNNLFGKYKTKRKLNLYLVAGIGLTNFNSVLKEISTNNVLRFQGYGNGKGLGGRTLEGVILGGIGVDVRVSDHMSIKLETVNRVMNSDLMDIVEKGAKYDIYNYTSLGISFKFGYNKRKSSIEQKTSVVPSFEVENPPVVIEDIVEEIIEESKPEPEIIVEAVEEEKPIVVEEPKIPELEYRVQIRANYRSKLSIEALSAKYNIPVEDIKENMHNGYYIYTIGSLATYNEASMLRVRVRTVYKVLDAFVVAFSNGKRMQ